MRRWLAGQSQCLNTALLVRLSTLIRVVALVMPYLKLGKSESGCGRVGCDLVSSSVTSFVCSFSTILSVSAKKRFLFSLFSLFFCFFSFFFVAGVPKFVDGVLPTGLHFLHDLPCVPLWHTGAAPQLCVWACRPDISVVIQVYRTPSKASYSRFRVEPCVN